MKLPLSLERSPLYDAVIEVRFETNIPPDAVTGIVYSKVSEQFNGGVEPLPISQLPRPMRDADPNLKYQPTHKFSSDIYYLNVGPNVIGLGFTRKGAAKYPGWKDFFAFYKTLLRKLESSITQIDRLGVRYVNFFQENDLMNGLNVSLVTGWEKRGITEEKSLTFFIKNDVFKTKVAIANTAKINDGVSEKEGQIIDIDTAYEGIIPMEDLRKRVSDAHDITKDIFYSLLNDKFLKELGPSTDVYPERES